MKRATTAGKSGPTAGEIAWPTAGKNLIRKDGCGKQTAGSEELHNTAPLRGRGRFRCCRQAQYSEWVVDVSEIIEQQFHMIQKVQRERSEFHRCRSSTRSFTVSAEVAGGVTGQSIDRDVDALADKL